MDIPPAAGLEPVRMRGRGASEGNAAQAYIPEGPRLRLPRPHLPNSGHIPGDWQEHWRRLRRLHDDAKSSLMAYRGAGFLGLDVCLEHSPSHCGNYLFDYCWCRCHSRAADFLHRPSEPRLVVQRPIDRFEMNVDRASLSSKSGRFASAQRRTLAAERPSAAVSQIPALW